MEIPSEVFGVIAGGLAAACGVLGKTWIDGKRVDKVDGPRTASDAWRVVFESVQSQVSGLTSRVAKLEAAIEVRDAAIEERDGVIRRLRSYVVLLQGILHKVGQEVPPPPDDELVGLAHIVAPERRSPVTSVNIVDKDGHEPH